MPSSPHDDPPRRPKARQGPPPTLRELATSEPGWMWIICDGCRRWQPLRLADAIARLGPDATSIELMAKLTCTACGRRGATLQHPSWSTAINAWQRYEDALAGRTGTTAAAGVSGA